MNEFFVTGTLRILASKHGTMYKISADHENLIDRFIAEKKYKENTSDDVRWVARKYLYYLEQKGHMTLEDVSVEEVRTFSHASLSAWHGSYSDFSVAWT